MNSTHAAAREFLSHGWAPIPVEFQNKKPIGANWQNLRITLEDVDHHFPPDQPRNVGVLLGEPSGWLVDVDLDHAYAGELADDFLPPTPAVFGRAGNPRSHRLYRATRPTESAKHRHKAEGTIVELRAGSQTVFPPSVHVSGELIEWDVWPAQPIEIEPERLHAAVKALYRAVVVRIALDLIDVTDQNDGSSRLFQYACRCVENGLDEAASLAVIRSAEREQPFPRDWSDTEICKRLEDAGRATRREERPPAPKPAFVSADKLITDFPHLREPVIDGIIRVGETGAVVAPTKRGKSWLTIDTGLAVAVGGDWLGYQVNQGDVLIIDNELHPEVIADRIKRVALARFLQPEDYSNRLFVESLRGRLVDLHTMSGYFDEIEAGRFKLIILDAFYRFLPNGMSENANAEMAQVFNALDRYAASLGCAFLFVHHSSKGDQSGKAVTDVGSGAGAQSRAVDAHLVMRQHDHADCVVLDGAVRSFPPLTPKVLRWGFPVWNADDAMDPARLKTASDQKQAANDANADGIIQELLRHKGTPQTRYELRKHTEFGEKRIDRAIMRGVNAGWLVQDGERQAPNGYMAPLYRLTNDQRFNGTPDSTSPPYS